MSLETDIVIITIQVPFPEFPVEILSTVPPYSLPTSVLGRRTCSICISSSTYRTILPPRGDASIPFDSSLSQASHVGIIEIHVAWCVIPSSRAGDTGECTTIRSFPTSPIPR